MALSIKDTATDRLARELAQVTGESITAAVATAVRERLDRVRGHAGSQGLLRELNAIALRCAALPLLDDRPESDLLSYDEHGLPT
jgi:antitoxin VapB